MKYIILSIFIFFLSYNTTYAIPFLWVIPFIYEIAILVYISIGVFASSFVCLLLRWRITLFILLSMSVVLSYLALILFVWPHQLGLMNIQFFDTVLDYQNISFYLLIGVVLSLLFVYKFWIYLLTYFLLALILLLNVPLVFSAYSLHIQFQRLINEFDTKVDNTLNETSPYILNNIFASQDFYYADEDVKHLCRITLSYYIHTGISYSKAAKKWDYLRLYTWLDTGKCRQIIEPIFHSLQK